MKKVCRILCSFSLLFLFICTISCKHHTVVKYSVSYVSDYGTAPEAISVFDGAILTAEELPELSESGYTFGGWFDQDEVQAVADEYTVTKDVTLTAKWEAVQTPEPEKEYSVTYKTDYGTAPTDEAKYKKDAEVVIAEAVSYSGYTFDGWSDGTTTYQAGDKYKMGDSNVTFTALWTANTTGITVSLPESTSKTISLDHTISGDNVSFTATAIENASYKWFLDGEVINGSDGNALITNTITIDTKNYAAGIYEVLVVVTTSTDSYSAKQNITVKK